MRKVYVYTYTHTIHKCDIQYTHRHTYIYVHNVYIFLYVIFSCTYMSACLCLYKVALDGRWGRRWSDRCVCLGSRSAFHIPLWYSALWPQETRPAKKLCVSLSPARSLSLSPTPASHLLSSLARSLPAALHSESLTSPSFYIQTWEIICHLAPRPPPSFLPFTFPPQTHSFVFNIWQRSPVEAMGIFLQIFQCNCQRTCQSLSHIMRHFQVLPKSLPRLLKYLHTWNQKRRNRI